MPRCLGLLGFSVVFQSYERLWWCLINKVEPTKKKPSKSLYAKATDTGINPKVAAKRLNIDWDAAADIEDDDTSDETEVPAVLVGLVVFFFLVQR